MRIKGEGQEVEAGEEEVKEGVTTLPFPPPSSPPLPRRTLHLAGLT